LFFDSDTKKVLEIDEVKLNRNFSETITLQDVLNVFSNEEEYWKFNFHKVKIAYATNKFTILPVASNNIQEVFNYLDIPLLENDIFETYNIAENQILYYTINQDIKSFFENRFKNIEWFFGDYGITNFANPKLSFKNHLACNIYGNDLSISHIQNNQVLFFNKFYIEQKEDLLYYLKLTYEQLQLNTNQFATYLYGFIEEKSPMYTFSFAYIRNYEIDRTLKHALDFQFTYDEHTLHYFYNLLALGK
jgi:hypothetical protein